ncbi:hypothetical protein IAG44_39310 [Streptomyces roseirectus]|uniref:Uncharacterized protein n=1 Tax=Streptomyces roseirectus TaxID=2768066 RepID=A0A7H0IQ17_9ACTN|nr:hypothetical protein [Streptomyces roseirectus]QNP74883.1 hypothetical protein IAG44_39310 [Streptomyces roseirectus]
MSTRRPRAGRRPHPRDRRPQAADFSRVFCGVYGIPPREYRERAAAHPELPHRRAE